jgi:hemoglobin
MRVPRRVLVFIPFMLVWSAGAAHAATLFAELGGRAGTTAIARDTMSRALSDPRIASIFADVDMNHLERQFGIQLCQIAGGPCIYHGLSMHDAHEGYAIRPVDFNALVEDMETTMSARGIPWRVQTRLLARLASMEPEVVSK